LWLRGRCRACGTRISPRYPAVEAATGVLFAAAFATTADSTVLLDALAFGTFLLTLGVVDAETRRLPDSLVGIGGVVALAIRVWASFTAGSMAQASDAVVAGVVGYVVLSLVRWLGGLAFRREAMGRGDPTFLGAIGFFLADWRLVLLTIGLSAIVGSVVGGMLIAARRGRATTAIPYGPFLALGAGIARLWGGRLMEFYLNGYG
jgi:leader peptidase (prepilin peptidase)/N-methyltransferase